MVGVNLGGEVILSPVPVGVWMLAWGEWKEIVAEDWVYLALLVDFPLSAQFSFVCKAQWDIEFAS